MTTTSASTAFPPTEPLPVLTDAPRWRDTLISLRVRNYRIYVIGCLIALTAVWMQRIAQDWLVLQISGSPASVGITTGLQFLPVLLFGPLGGLIVDRYPKRTLIMITQASSVVTSGTLAVLCLTGTVQLWHVYVIAFVLGCVTVVDNPARQVLTGELVGAQYLGNAVSVNSSVFQLAGLIGPALSGLLVVAVGSGWAFAINAVACFALVGGVRAIRVSELHTNTRVPAAKGQLRQGLAYAWRKPDIRYSLVIIAVLALVSINLPTMLAAFADEEFRVGAGGYGLFNSAVAIGSLIGALLSARRKTVKLSYVVVGTLAYGTALIVASRMPSPAALVIVLAVVGGAWLTLLTCANTLIQLSTNPMVRGRVVSLYLVVLLGCQAIGGPLTGVLVESLGVRAAMTVAGVAPILVAGLVALLARPRAITA